MEIRITYLVTGGDAPITVRLAPADYFEPIEEGETFEESGVPHHDHAFQYVPIDWGRLAWTVLSISEVSPEASHPSELAILGTRSRTVRTQFHAHGWMSHRLDVNGYEELIHNFEIDNKLTLIAKTVKPPAGTWGLISALAYRRGEQGEQAERLDDAWSLMQLGGFCGDAEYFARMQTFLDSAFR